jgi:AcrR family transcriptional regulator
MKKPTRERICAVVLKLLDKSGDGNGVSIRRVAAEVGITPMAIYKHFPNRDALLNGATSAEYRRIGAYFERANARKNVKGLRGMLGIWIMHSIIRTCFSTCSRGSARMRMSSQANSMLANRQR